MKRIIMILVAAVLISGTVFARGTMENGDSSSRRQNSSAAAGRGVIDGETVQMSGTIIEVEGQPVLQTTNGTWSLSARGFSRTDAEIPWGETIEVSGTATECSSDDCDCDMDAEGHIFVNSALSDGREYAFSAGGNADGDGRQGGQMSGNNNAGNRQSGSKGQSSRGSDSRRSGNGGNGGNNQSDDWTQGSGRHSNS